MKGIGVLWPGASTLRTVFSTTGPDGKRELDERAREAAIQQVLSACKEFNAPCGFPSRPEDMKQGFSVFVMNWSDASFKAVERTREAANHPPTTE